MINRSFLYYGFGLKDYECSGVEYKGNTIIFKVSKKSRQIYCPNCGGHNLVKNGTRTRDILGLPIGGKKTILRVKVQRYKCKNKECDYDQQEDIPFVNGGKSYTHRFAKYVVDLLKLMNIKGVSCLLDVGWDTIKDIHMTYLNQHYKPVSFEGVENIGIDEFAVKKGHVYKTIVVDLDTGRIIYVGDGKGADSLTKFWKKVKKKGIKIKHVATDLSSAFIASVAANAPEAIHVFDHFHVLKLMNEKLDDIRRKAYNQEKDINKRQVIKGTRYLILQNGRDIFDGDFKSRLDNALSMNDSLSKGYYLKESLGEIWKQPNKAAAEKALDDWVRQANDSKVTQLIKMAATIMSVRTGILAWYDCCISTGPVEGINNKIKVMKRNAYGFRDDKYFELRLLSLHDCHITRNVG